MIKDTFGRPMRDLRISVTDRCNFRCPYCMPAEIFGESYRFLPKDEILTFEEIQRLTRIFAGLGVTSLAILWLTSMPDMAEGKHTSAGFRKLLPMVSVWETKEGAKYQSMQTFIRGEYLVLAKPE